MQNIVGCLKSYWHWIAAISSGVLLAISFPPLAIDEAAWIALAPLILLARSRRGGFATGTAAGLVFWLLSLQWLIPVTVAGWFVLAVYCSLYFGAFTFAYGHLFPKNRNAWWQNLLAMAGAALLWSGLEVVRASLFTGFSWNQLGVSQYNNTVLIQIAEWGGVYAVSAMIVILNSAIALTAERYIEQRGVWGKRPHLEMAMALIIVALAFSYGVQKVRTPPQDDERQISVALIQPNVEQRAKWDQEYFDEIYARLERLTENASPHVDICVWPETAVPEFLRESVTAGTMLGELTRDDAQLLVGSMDYELAEDGNIYYNSSFLIADSGRMVSKYDKQHLVLFGEYVPFEEQMPFLKSLTPIEGSFRPGSAPVIFHAGPEEVPLSPLICFEDAFPYLARNAVRAGARLLANQTNDAWFDPSSGSTQHLAQSIFRCVENRVPMLRCANTGVTCWIDRKGRIREKLTDNTGSMRIKGFLRATIAAPSDDMELTFNTRSNGFAGRFSAGASIAMLLYAAYRALRRGRIANG